MSGRQSKFLQWINYRIRVTIQDGRVLIGTFLAFDKHMNLVLSDTEEFSHITVKNKKDSKEKERKRVMGLVILRGDSIISISAESPPSQNNKRFNDLPNPPVGVMNQIGKIFSGQVNQQPGLTSVGKGVGVPNMINNIPGRGIIQPQSDTHNDNIGINRPPIGVFPPGVQPPFTAPGPLPKV